MRPEILFPLFTSVDRLPGVGKKLAPLLTKLCGSTRWAVLRHLPVGVATRHRIERLAEIAEETLVAIPVTIEGHQEPFRRRTSPYRVYCSDAAGSSLVLTFFHAEKTYLQRALPPGERRLVGGRLERFGPQWQITHPDLILPATPSILLPAHEPNYALTAGLTQKQLRRIMAGALADLPDLPEWIDPNLREREGWPGWKAALEAAHQPKTPAEIEPHHPVRQRLAYDELFAHQLALALTRRHYTDLPGRRAAGDGRFTEAAIQHLPFQLTAAQKHAIQEIFQDMAKPHRMLRLLQGDVGSGKTILAFLAMLRAVESGGQAAFLAPTDLLAQQHHANLAPLAAKLGIELGLFTGRSKGKSRDALLKELATGRLSMIVGTHTLVQEGLAFHDLALAVIDEQHRFGVHQRMTLADKGRGTDLLVMTATPIPRSLMLAFYGDLDVSRLQEKPPGRQPIDTRVLPLARMGEVIGAIERRLPLGDRIYWICPLVEESAVIDLAAATARYADLSERFPGQVGLVHGRLKGAEKDAAMTAFRDGTIRILVATTVIEVGVDVPEANLMVIEHAERFGLAQLHQLRGRIGRGKEASTCLLLYGAPVSETARARLAIMRKTEDGFLIAEEDLRLRGAGEILGTRQSGFPDFHFADLAAHRPLLEMARKDAQMAVETDPRLERPRALALIALLYLFEQESAVKTLRSG